ncbi:MAG: hypothetical protein PHC86_05785 [Eubacteriales bacterium]|nr:hypothetical protein [Eubacteriales bacterium]
MPQLKRSLEDHVFNQQTMADRIRVANLQHEVERSAPMNKKWFWTAGVAAALVVALTASLTLMAPPVLNKSAESVPAATNLAVDAEATAYAMISVDINPSFEVYVDEHGIVIKSKAKNDDAKTLDVQDLLGKTQEDALKAIIERATEAKFIDASDDLDDYVIVSTVILKKDDPDAEANQESMGAKIKAALAEEGALDDTTKVAVIKSTLRDKFAADEKAIPLGLYIIKGMLQVDSDGNPVEDDGTWIKVADFVRNPDALAKLKERAEIVESNNEINKEAQADRQAEREQTKDAAAAARDAAKEARKTEPIGPTEATNP